MMSSIHSRTATEPATGASERPASADARPSDLSAHSTLSAGKYLSRKRFLAIAAALVIVLGAGAFVFVHIDPSRGGINGATQTITVQRTDFEDVLRLTGTTQAVRSQPVLAPRLEGAQMDAMVVTRLAPTGTRVHKGDLLVEFDRQAQVKDFLDKQAAYRDLVDQVAQKQAANDGARATDETSLKQAEDDLKKAQLEIGKDPILSRIDAEKNQETLDEAQATFKQLQQTYILKRQAAAADLKTLEIQRDRARATMLYAQSNAQKMEIHSPMDGVVVLNTTWLGGRMGEVQEGDQVRAGVPFMNVVDPSDMDVRVDVNQADLARLRIGQQAVVHLDAYPGLSLPGTLEGLTPLGHSGDFSDKVRTFAAIFAIHGTSGKLMPDLSAAVDVVLDRSQNAVVVPNQSVVHADGKEYVWLKSGMSYEKHQVTTGPSNDLQTVIAAGLTPGNVVEDDPAATHGKS